MSRRLVRRVSHFYRAVNEVGGGAVVEELWRGPQTRFQRSNAPIPSSAPVVIPPGFAPEQLILVLTGDVNDARSESYGASAAIHFGVFGDHC